MHVLKKLELVAEFMEQSKCLSLVEKRYIHSAISNRL